MTFNIKGIDHVVLRVAEWGLNGFGQPGALGFSILVPSSNSSSVSGLTGRHLTESSYLSS